MNEKRTSILDNGLIWFGAAVSIAEIITGTYMASLGLTKVLKGYADDQYIDRIERRQRRMSVRKGNSRDK